MSRDPITFRWQLLLTVVLVTTAGLAIGLAMATTSLSDAQGKVETALVNASRTEDEHAKALECADFADDKTRDEFIKYGGPAKGCDMGYVRAASRRDLVSDAKLKADKAGVNAEIVQRNVTAASGVVDRWIFGLGLAITMGLASLVVAPRRSARPAEATPTSPMEDSSS